MSSVLAVTALLFTIAGGMLSFSWLTSFWRSAPRPRDEAAGDRRGNPRNNAEFLGSQIGGKSVINYGYTDMPWNLMAYDIYYFFKFMWALPYILFPLTPSDSGDLDELSFTAKNVFCILAFILAFPALVLLPVWMAALTVGLFLLLNHSLCILLNGQDVEYRSSPQYAPALPEHAHEQWIFINGVAVGSHWMQSNLDRLALTFKRPILGIHNKTAGILFDVLECLVQRNFGYATADVRVCYRIIKEMLYKPQFSKVVFILHSQGAIEGSMIIDWLLQELPQDLLSKLEVYTFGNAANHFNNPHRKIVSQDEAFRNPLAASTDSTKLTGPGSGTSTAAPAPASQPNVQQLQSSAPIDTGSGTIPGNSQSFTTANTPTPIRPALTFETSALAPSAVSGRAIGHIEHYAHTTDFVALWGVLHFATTAPGTQTVPRFIGRVFIRSSPRGGHQLVQHYLDGLFPLSRDAATGALVACAEDSEFMESEVVVGVEGDEMRVAREAMELSWLGGNGDGANVNLDAVEVHGVSPVESRKGRHRTRAKAATATAAKVKVKELSRLWQYRNGRSPDEKPPLLVRDADGVVRTATI
ncbi:hypothetical protein B0T26DRAFT_650470 [Lasiosphaeria miniovina]|uniref:Uncharacterized protein n=1 Tax=Lasiosphaeria miniovina TaxID=1954250 RepID=A0AA40AC92_9PEZI|nr:uncharacterized protein B0T26DRAFT_650470 [Lasiosphaeria miniovina]KAK0713038.1 hypothetical protein B0T26DRAFT_650470 [Lasiosphaeria miniovina]